MVGCAGEEKCGGMGIFGVSVCVFLHTLLELGARRSAISRESILNKDTRELYNQYKFLRVRQIDQIKISQRRANLLTITGQNRYFLVRIII